MATLAELQAEVTRLTAANAALTQAVTDEHAQVNAQLENLNLTITDLKKQIEDLQAGQTIDQATVDALKAQIDSTEAQAAAIAAIFTPAP